MNFHWIEPRRLAGSSAPCSESDLDYWVSQGIRSVISLTERPIDKTWTRAHGLAVLHLPIDDMTAPGQQQLREACDFIEQELANRRPLVVHCHAGKGRTGTILSAWLIQSGVSPEAAIAKVRSSIPGAIETPEQEACLVEFARRAD